MIDRNKFHAFLRKALSVGDVQDAHAAVSLFMCKCLMLIRPLLPAVGRSTLELALAHWMGAEGQGGNLESARVKCWRYLDEKNLNSVSINDKEDAAMRALLCVLYEVPESEEFVLDSAEWFATMFDRLGDYSEEFEKLMGV